MSDIPSDIWLCISEFGDLRYMSRDLLHKRFLLPACLSRRMRTILHHVLPMKLVITPARVVHGHLLQWFMHHHASNVSSLHIVQQLPNAYQRCAQNLLECLKHCGNLTSLTMNACDHVINVHELGRMVQSLKLSKLHLDMPMRNDLNPSSVKNIFLVGMRCSSLRLNMKMCDLTDDILLEFHRASLARPGCFIGKTPCHQCPQWTHLHLGLKHNLITDVGTRWMWNTIHHATHLKRLHINLSYNRMRSLITPPLHHVTQGFTIKVDGDVFELCECPMALDAGFPIRNAPDAMQVGFCAHAFICLRRSASL